MLRTAFAVPTLFVCVLATAVSPGAEPPALPFVATACVRTESPPTVDGELNEACWQATRPMGPFVKMTLGTIADVQSEAYLVHDGETLYIGVRCEEPDMASVKAGVTERDGPAYGDDCIEIFLIPPASTVLADFGDRDRYFHLVVNTLGTRYDEIGYEAPQAFDGEWQAAVAKGDQRWQLEVGIPLRELGVTVKDGDVWTGNVSRTRWSSREYSSWARIKRSFHDAANFGRIVFTADLAATEQELDEIELAALRSGLLSPRLVAAAGLIDTAQDTIQALPRDCRAQVEAEAARLQARQARLSAGVDALSSTDFRTGWEDLHADIMRLEQDAAALEDETAMLAATDGGARPWHIFVTRAMTNDRLLANRWPRDVRPIRRLRIAACPGEYESATLSIYAVRALEDVRLEIGELQSKRARLPASCIDPYVIKCWYQAGRGIGDLGQRLLTPELLLKDDDLVRVDHREKRNLVRARSGSSEYLDATLGDSSNLSELLPRDADELLPLNIPARTLKQFWLTARVPADAEPGRYRGRITITARDQAPASLPIEIEVLPFVLSEPMLEYSIYYRGKLDPDDAGSIGSERKSREQFAAEMRDMVAHGVTNPTIYQPYDEELLSEVFDLREAAGMKGRPVMALGLGTGAPQTQEALDALKIGVRQWLDFIGARGYAELYVYGIDEASGDRLKAERAAFQAVHEAGAKVFVACYRDYFDVVGDLLDVPVWSGAPDPEEARKAHSVGHRIFNYGHPQCGVEEPETYRRNFGLLLWKAGYDGAMDYAYQHSFGHEWNDFDHQSYRDHTMAYPTENGVIGTIQWEGFREAVDDVRYLTTLTEAVESVKAEGGRKARLARETESWIESIDPQGDLDLIRRGMIERMIRLTKR
jgi:hypothetical protein